MSDRLPTWFRQRLPAPGVLSGMRAVMETRGLHTVCESAMCPNRSDCFSRGTATFLLMGDTCTRRCSFCAVVGGAPEPLDEYEPERVASAVRELGLRHVVVTSVTRDDLPDGGAGHFARTIRRLHAIDPRPTVEVLVPDFQGDAGAVRAVVDTGPEVLNHNLETVPRLYPDVRPGADYGRSLDLVARAKQRNPDTLTKSGLMVGLGETREEMLEVMTDLRAVGCDLMTIGQYLQPSPAHHPVVRYVRPEEMTEYEGVGLRMGFRGVASAPLVRSSFDAVRLLATARDGMRPPVGE